MISLAFDGASVVKHFGYIVLVHCLALFSHLGRPRFLWRRLCTCRKL